MSMVLSPDKRAQEAMKKAASEAEHDRCRADDAEARTWNHKE